MNLYERLVGDRWRELHAEVRHLHGGGGFQGAGVFAVHRGRRALARALLSVLSLPDEAAAVSVGLRITADVDGETWHRKFGNKAFITRQSYGAGGFLVESIGPIEVVYKLAVTAGALHYVQLRSSLRVGLLRLPLPVIFSPMIAAREWGVDDMDGVHASVIVSNPVLGDLIRYEGHIKQEPTAE
jgi:hypothetical protein